jgi:rod shape-determining protein MreC
MLAVPGRHRSLTLLIVTLVVQLLMLAVQVKRNSHVRLIRVWTVDSITPFERAGTWMVGKVTGVFGGYFDLVHVRSENLALRDQLNQLEMRNTALEGQAAEVQRLNTLLDFKTDHPEAPMIAARVIATSADTASHVVYINLGTRDGIKTNMAVITPDGVVGKVFEAYGSVSEVLLATDKDSGVGALIEGTRTQGVVGGTGDPALTMKYVSNDENVTLGQHVLTSGEDQIFPKDVPVGTITQVKSGNPFKQIQLHPAAHLDRLEEVLVLLTRQDLIPKGAPLPAAPAASPSSAKPAPATKPAAPPAKPSGTEPAYP